MKKLFYTLLMLACIPTVQTARAQYYSTGQAPFSQRWMSINNDSLRIVYPDNFRSGAYRVLDYMESVRPDIGWGLNVRVMPMSVVLKTESFNSNGITIWAPKRIEIVTIPETETYALPWLKQLSVHEYRHAAQYTALNTHAIKGIGYVLGQQWQLLTTGLLPFWWIEGDAVDAETQFALFGRGLQPSFSMHYRAMGRTLTNKRNPDKWFCGSYRQYVPSHYELGYQMVTHADATAGEYVWDDVVDFAARRPYLIASTQVGMKKYLGYKTRQLFKETFTSLNDFWDTLPQTRQSAQRIETPTTSYTTYRWPLFENDSTLIALKSDFDRSYRWVRVDIKSGKEEVLAYTGYVNSRPTLSGRTLYWTEMQQSTFWEQRQNSQLCSMDLDKCRPQRIDWERRVLYPDVTDQGDWCYVKYDYSGRYSIVWGAETTEFDEGCSLHGLTAANDKLYYIFLDDSGMGIGCVDMATKELSTIKRPSAVSIANLRYADNKLLFGSIASGKDEVHYIDLTDKSEYRATTSTFGAFEPALSPDGKTIAMTLYNSEGYGLAIQQTEAAERVEWSQLPQNIVNPKQLAWNVMKTDTLQFTSDHNGSEKVSATERRYRRAAHLFDFHSWAPASYDPDDLMSGEFGSAQLGITLLSQNLLSTATARVNWGYSFDGHSSIQANMKYLGFAPKIELDYYHTDRRHGTSLIVQTLGEEQNFGYYYWIDNGVLTLKECQTQQAPKSYPTYSRLYARTYLPILLENSYHTRFLTPSIEYSHTNTLRYNPQKAAYTKGVDMVFATLQYTDNIVKAKRDFLPRWGLMLKASAGRDVSKTKSLTTINLTARAYLPGICCHHSIRLRAGYQNALGKGILNYSTTYTDLTPRGLRSYPTPIDYCAASFDYQLPLAYPDWGLSGLFFMKRLRLNIFADGAINSGFRTTSKQNGYISTRKVTNKYWSTGGTLYIDAALLRLPSQADVSIGLSVYLPSDTRKPVFGATMSVPL